MNLGTPEERTLACAEYVLGTLDDAELAAFRQSLSLDASLQLEVGFWQDRLRGQHGRHRHVSGDVRAGAPEDCFSLGLEVGSADDGIHGGARARDAERARHHREGVIEPSRPRAAWTVLYNPPATSMRVSN